MEALSMPEVRRQLVAAGVTIGFNSEPGKLSLRPGVRVTPELLAAATAAKAELLWWLKADQRIADTFRDIAVRYEALPQPRPDVTTKSWRVHMAAIEAAYQHWDPAELDGALDVFRRWAIGQLTPDRHDDGAAADPAPTRLPGLARPNDGTPCPPALANDGRAGGSLIDLQPHSEQSRERPDHVTARARRWPHGCQPPTTGAPSG